ncbi:uncharacterized protein UDID_17278 [Ustilago sp. UG-2017a]|nr:uncharacterized protein UDID_17278 [Ustilago sp. UG-2017a]
MLHPLQKAPSASQHCGNKCYKPSHETRQKWPNLQHSKVRVIQGTPNSGMSPGDIFSPFHLPHQPHASPESLFLDQLEDDLDTTIAFDGVSRVGAQSPIFPWSTPTIAAPPPAKIRTESMTRAERGSLRVTNAF